MATIEKTQGWNCYALIYVWQMAENGCAKRDYLDMVTIHENNMFSDTYETFTEIYEHVAKREIEERKGWGQVHICASRQADWCVDSMLRKYAEGVDAKRDCYDPDFVHIEIVCTPYTIRLKREEGEEILP